MLVIIMVQDWIISNAVWWVDERVLFSVVSYTSPLHVTPTRLPVIRNDVIDHVPTSASPSICFQSARERLRSFNLPVILNPVGAYVCEPHPKVHAKRSLLGISLIFTNPALILSRTLRNFLLNFRVAFGKRDELFLLVLQHEEKKQKTVSKLKISFSCSGSWSFSALRPLPRF